MSTIYDMLAPFYDELNGDIDYEKWADFLVPRFHSAAIPVREVLDLGCGTGSMTLALARRGYDMVGVDLSPDMLSRARERAYEDEKTRDILFLLQDMRSFELYGTVQAAVCTLDGINHLTCARDLDATLALLHNYIEPQGLLIFDVNAKRKFEEVYADNVYTMESEDAYVVWQNDYREKTGVCDFYITLFKRESDGRYTRYEECQREKHYSCKTLQRHLEKAGFRLLDVRGDDFEEAKNDNFRYHLIAERI